MDLKIKEIPINYISRSKKMGKKISLIDAFYAIKAILIYKFLD